MARGYSLSPHVALVVVYFSVERSRAAVSLGTRDSWNTAPVSAVVWAPYVQVLCIHGKVFEDLSTYAHLCAVLG